MLDLFWSFIIIAIWFGSSFCDGYKTGTNQTAGVFFMLIGGLLCTIWFDPAVKELLTDLRNWLPQSGETINSVTATVIMTGVAIASMIAITQGVISLGRGCREIIDFFAS